MNKFKVVSKRLQTQMDDGVEASSPEEAAQMVARRQSNAPNVSQDHGWIFEVEVLDSNDKHLATFKLDEQHHVVKASQHEGDPKIAPAQSPASTMPAQQGGPKIAPTPPSTPTPMPGKRSDFPEKM